MRKKSEKPLTIFHLDLNFVSLKRDYLRDWLRRLPGLGFNAILWELTDKVQWETCPECVWPEALSKPEFRKLLAYSRSLGLEAIPLLQTVGHAESVLLHKKYHALRELPDRHDCYCTSNPKVTRFLQSWVEEYLALFGPLRYFHLGGDEAYVFGKCPRCAAAIAQQGRHQLLGRHIRAVAEPLLKKQIRPGIWNDMLMKDPGATGLDHRQFVIWDWNYWDTDQPPAHVNLHELGRFRQDNLQTSGMLKEFPKLVDAQGRLRPFGSVQVLKQHGFDVILCSAARSWGDTFFAPRPHHAANIVGAAQTVSAEKLLGHCVTSWSVRLNDYVAQLPYLSLATAATAQPGKSPAALLEEACRDMFGANPAKFIQAINLLSISLPFAQSGSTGVQWNTMVDSLPAPKNFLKKYLAELERTKPQQFHSFPVLFQQAIANVPVGIKLLTEFFAEAQRGFDIIDAWLTGARFLLTIALVGDRLLKNAAGREFAVLLEQHKTEYAAFLRRREDPLSAAKNAGLVYDTLIDRCRG